MTMLIHIIEAVVVVGVAFWALILFVVLGIIKLLGTYFERQALFSRDARKRSDV